MRRPQIFLLIFALAVVTALASGADWPARFQAGGLTPQQQRGQKIYLSGTNAAGQNIVASTGNSTAEIPAAYLTCASCHGQDGAGKPEGGVSPSNITWEALTRPYVVMSASGRQHPPYDERLIKRAVTLGIDPAGNKLHALMPRYRFSQQDAQDLIAYLKTLGKNFDPGLSDTTIKIATTVITAGQFAELSQSARAALAAYFDAINQQGGIFNRRIELSQVSSLESPEQRIKAMRASIDSDQPFALVAIFMAGAEAEFASLIKEKSLPLVGAFTLAPPASVPPNPFAFYISAGLKQQCGALASYAAGRFASQNLKAAIISTGDAPARESAQAIKQVCAEAGWKTVEESFVESGSLEPEKIVKALSAQSVKIVFLLTPGQMQEAILAEAQKQNWRATYFIPGLLAGRNVMEISETAADQLFLSVSSLPSDQTEDALIEYKKLAEAYKLPATHAASQMQALAAAKTIVEGLKRAGRDASRQKLVEALEGMREFKTGLTPPLTFNPNRRIGAAGAYIVTVDKSDRRLIPVSRWIEQN